MKLDAKKGIVPPKVIEEQKNPNSGKKAIKMTVGLGPEISDEDDQNLEFILYQPKARK